MPLSILYGMGMSLRRFIIRPKEFDIPIISVGNLIVGGSGKTPFVIALASRYEEATIISRGYGRLSKGFIEVSRDGQILCGVEASGDEAMLMARLLPNCSVIVCEDREKAVTKAINDGARLIILDDGFNRVNIKKFEILLESRIVANSLPFPAGPMREFSYAKKYANLVLKEDVDFKRVVTFSNLRDKMLLITAISNPNRLIKYLPNGIIAKKILPDHSYFDEDMILTILKDSGADSILVTQKDVVKIEQFMLPLSIMHLRLEINRPILKEIDEYINLY
jgi:tetraacyldisaccharide 4'-kinase